MHCSAVQTLLSQERDRPLTAGERAALAQHLTGCAECRQLRERLEAAAGEWREVTQRAAVPDAATEWRALLPRLRGAAAPATGRRRAAPIVWLGIPLAAAAAVALGLFLRPTGIAPAAPAVARAEFVEAGSAEATTMVYVDDESGWLVVWASDADDARTHG